MLHPLRRLTEKPDQRADAAVRVTLAELIALSHPANLLALPKSSIRAARSGAHLSRIKGRGMAFDEVRLYTPGDDVRSIDWRVTARTGKTHTKLFREERERPVFVVVDYRPSMFFATRGQFKSVLAAKLAALLAWRASLHGDRVGGELFTRNQQLAFKPQSGKRALLHLFNALTHHQQVDRANSSDQDASTLTLTLARLSRRARSGSLIFLLSDFRQLTPAAESLLLHLARRCDVTMMLIHDPLEGELPSRGRYQLANGERELTINTADKKFLRDYRQRFRLRQAHLEQLAVQYRMQLISCSTSDDPFELLRDHVRP